MISRDFSQKVRSARTTCGLSVGLRTQHPRSTERIQYIPCHLLRVLIRTEIAAQGYTSVAVLLRRQPTPSNAPEYHRPPFKPFGFFGRLKKPFDERSMTCQKQ